MDTKSHHKLPSEFTTAREIEDAIKTSSCQIWIQQGATIPSTDIKRIELERFHSPYRSLETGFENVLFDKFETPVTCCIVYIRSFTNSGHDFVYCVPDSKHLSKFYGGTYGARDYRGPVLGTLVVLTGAVIEKVGPINWRRYTKVPKYTEKINGVRWRYLFATAKRAWSTMTFYAIALPVLEAMVADVPVQDQESEPEARLPKPISDSQHPPEAQRIAIQQNVELLKKKPNHQDRVFEYLELELVGWCSRHSKNELTKQQHRLVARLRDNADDFSTLYNDEDKAGNTVPNTDFSKEEEARLLSERDVIIRQIQEQLTLPTTVRNNPDNSDLPGLEPSNTPGNPENSEDDSSSDEDNLLSEPIDIECPTKEEANLIQRFADFTGAHPYQCKRYLYTADWDLDLALSNLQEDQTRSKLSVFHGINNPGPKERVDAVTTFKGLTNADSAVASSYLTGAGWDLGVAVSTFFEDSEAPVNDSKGGYDSASTMASKFSAKISEQPVIQKLHDMGKYTTRPAGEPAIMSPALEALIHQRMTKLDAEVHKIQRQIEEMEDDDLDITMQDVTWNERYFSEDSELYAVPRGKLRVVNEDPSPRVTHRKGTSHAGLPLILDEAGNVVSYERPTGTPYQQYLAMRCRLQVQNYGHEAIPSDEDPHRGIPTRERCPAPLVQEEINDFPSSSLDDTIIALKNTDPVVPRKSVSKATLVNDKRAAWDEMVDLISMLIASKGETPAKSIASARRTDTSIPPEGQEVFNWTKYAMKARKSANCQDRTQGEEKDDVDSVLGSVDGYEVVAADSATRTKDVRQDEHLPIKGVLRNTSQTRKPSMKVRFLLNDEDCDVPTPWQERIEEIEERRPERGRSRLSDVDRSEMPSIKVRADAAEDGKDTSSTRDGPASKPIHEGIEEERETQSIQTKDENVDAKAEKRKAKAQRKEAEVQRKRELFISKQEDAWDGLDSDGGELDLESESDIDAEGEEEFEEQEAQVELQEEKDKRPPRVDEKMED